MMPITAFNEPVFELEVLQSKLPVLEASEQSPSRLTQRYSAKRPLHHVDFFCHAPHAAKVCLVGDFNGWQPTANPMRPKPDGWWMATLELPHGYHLYLFLIDGKPVLDPNASGKAPNERNQTVSLMAVS